MCAYCIRMEQLLSATCPLDDFMLEQGRDNSKMHP